MWQVDPCICYVLWSKLLCANRPSLSVSNLDLSIHQDLFDTSQTCEIPSILQCIRAHLCLFTILSFLRQG